MKRQEFLLNLTLLVIIGVLVFLIYESRDLPRGLDELEVPAAISPAGSNRSDKSDPSEQFDGSEISDSSDTTSTISMPGTETQYASAGSSRGGDFGKKSIFRALLTPTPTPTPTPPPPPPTPDIGKSLGGWKLLSVYQGKAMLEDVQLSQQGAEGAIWEMAVGDTKQVDVGNGIMKTVSLKTINNENPYSPEITLGMEDTTAERNINLDTEPATAAPAPAPKK